MRVLLNVTKNSSLEAERTHLVLVHRPPGVLPPTEGKAALSPYDLAPAGGLRILKMEVSVMVLACGMRVGADGRLRDHSTYPGFASVFFSRDVLVLN
ncbi:hypothetical protein MUK42_36302 [Musa troglodytarum]|uniref:Uncharacterized protein n=1 Tax=Musa troglodytarum TaxID=320322 RepID=A0A9E7ECD5_9LILI|nr:hypothetical protein MUK42_36302 [Musa troglodytarum]